MTRRARANAVLTSVLAWACGLAVAVALVTALLGLGPGLGPGWTRAALAQQPGDEPQAAEWQRLAGPLPYRPSEPDGGWLTEADIDRAADLIADLGLFFAKLSETDPNAGARRVWAQGEAAYGDAADELRTAIEGNEARSAGGALDHDGGTLTITDSRLSDSDRARAALACCRPKTSSRRRPSSDLGRGVVSGIRTRLG